jgi:hypothetical protein
MWPWWLLLPPLAVLLVIIFNLQFRRRILDSFGREKVEPETAAFRKRLMWILFVLAAIATVCCVIGAGSEEIAWWLIPLSLCAPAFRLCAMSITPGRWGRLRRVLCDNLLELFLIASAILAFYSITLWRLYFLPLDGFTLAKLMEWDRAIKETHEFLERHAPGFIGYVVFLSAALALRLLADVWPALQAANGHLSGLLAAGIKWGQRASSAVAIAASLTFLAIQQGPVQRIGVQLREATSGYRHFQSVLADQVDLAMRRALLSKAWNERPPTLIAALSQAGQFHKERKEFEEERFKAEFAFGIKPPSVEPFPLSIDLPRRHRITAGAADTMPDLSWTPAQLEQADKEADDEAAHSSQETAKQPILLTRSQSRRSTGRHPPTCCSTILLSSRL